MLACHGRGEFFMTEAGTDATDVRWVCSFAPKNLLAVRPLQLIVKTGFNPFMQNALATIRAVAKHWASTVDA